MEKDENSEEPDWDKYLLTKQKHAPFVGYHWSPFKRIKVFSKWKSLTPRLYIDKSIL